MTPEMIAYVAVTVVVGAVIGVGVVLGMQSRALSEEINAIDEARTLRGAGDQ